MASFPNALELSRNMLRIDSTSGHEYMKMRVVPAGASRSLEDDNISHIEFDAGAGIENIFLDGFADSHEEVSNAAKDELLRYRQNLDVDAITKSFIDESNNTRVTVVKGAIVHVIDKTESKESSDETTEDSKE